MSRAPEDGAMPSLLAQARALIGLEKDAARQRLGGGLSEDPDDGYEAMQGVASLENGDVFPGTLYLKDDRVEMVYLGPGGLHGVTAADLESELPGEATLLRSRAGKTANMHVRAEEGVAYSAEGDEVHFVEVFRPRSLQDYESEIYNDPGPFIR